jgi:hypothetical protein
LSGHRRSFVATIEERRNFRRRVPWEDDQEQVRPMAYQTDDEGMNDQQKDEKKRAKAERDQLKKDREAQREKLRKDRLAVK